MKGITELWSETVGLIVVEQRPCWSEIVEVASVICWYAVLHCNTEIACNPWLKEQLERNRVVLDNQVDEEVIVVPMHCTSYSWWPRIPFYCASSYRVSPLSAVQFSLCRHYLRFPTWIYFGTDKPPPRSKSSNAELLPDVNWDWLTLAPLVVGTEINALFGFCLCLPLSRRWLAIASCVLKFCLHGSNLTPTPLELPPAFATTWRSGLVATGPSGHVVTDSVSILNLVNSENKGWPWLFVNYSKKTGLHTSTSCILFRSNPRMNN